jgi:hypothetical protein
MATPVANAGGSASGLTSPMPTTPAVDDAEGYVPKGHQSVRQLIHVDSGSECPFSRRKSICLAPDIGPNAM